MAKPALGRGLGALLGGNAPGKSPAPAHVTSPAPAVAAAPGPAVPGNEVKRVPLSRIHPCPFQPRKAFTQESLQELADSIKEQGIVQPLIVRETSSGLELIAGERRWRAAQLAGIAEVPVITRQADDRLVLELALIENLQRENLNPLEEAQGYAQLIAQFELTQEEVALKVGKSRVAVANALRLLKLPERVQTQLKDGLLTVGHAKVILGLATPKEQEAAAERVLKNGLNVRQTEALVAELQQAAQSRQTQSPVVKTIVRDPHVSNLESKLREKLATKVHLRYAAGRGALEINFFSDDELDRILQLLGVTTD